MQDRQPPTATFKTEARYANQEPIAQSYSHYRLGSIIRTKVFIEERYVPASEPHIPMTVGVEVRGVAWGTIRREVEEARPRRRHQPKPCLPSLRPSRCPALQESAASGRRKETSDRDEFDEPEKHARHILGKGEWRSWCAFAHAATPTTVHASPARRTLGPPLPPPPPRRITLPAVPAPAVALPAPAVGDAPVSYARWRLVTLAELGLPSTNGGDPAQQYVGLIDRLAVLPSYRQRGYGAATLLAVFQDIAYFMVSRNILLERISMFIHYSTLGLGAARTAAKLGMVAVGDRHAVDPSHFYNPAFIGDVGVQEFATTAQALLSVVGIAGDGTDAGAAAGGAAASTI